MMSCNLWMSWFSWRRALDLTGSTAVDALTGQDAVGRRGVQWGFGIDGIIMTKMDGDFAEVLRYQPKMVTGKPIKFMGTVRSIMPSNHSTQIDSFENSRNEVMPRASSNRLRKRFIPKEEAARMEAKFRKNQFDLNDFLGRWGRSARWAKR